MPKHEKIRPWIIENLGGTNRDLGWGNRSGRGQPRSGRGQPKSGQGQPKCYDLKEIRRSINSFNWSKNLYLRLFSFKTLKSDSNTPKVVKILINFFKVNLRVWMPKIIKILTSFDVFVLYSRVFKWNTLKCEFQDQLISFSELKLFYSKEVFVSEASGKI